MIDPAGRVVERWPMYQESVGRMNFNFINGTTFYTEYGDWFAWGCLLAAAVALFWSQRPHYTPRKGTDSVEEAGWQAETPAPLKT